MINIVALNFEQDGTMKSVKYPKECILVFVNQGSGKRVNLIY